MLQAMLPAREALAVQVSRGGWLDVSPARVLAAEYGAKCRIQCDVFMTFRGIAQLGETFFKAPLHLGDGLLCTLIGFFEERGVQLRRAGFEALFLLARFPGCGLNKLLAVCLGFFHQLAGGVLGGQQAFEGFIHGSFDL